MDSSMLGCSVKTVFSFAMIDLLKKQSGPYSDTSVRIFFVLVTFWQFMF